MSRRRDYVLVDSQDDAEEEKVAEGTPIALGTDLEDGSDIPVAVAIDAEDVQILNGDGTEPRMAILLNFVKVKMSTDNQEYKIDLGSETNAFRDTTVAELRDKIATKSGVPPDRQRLIYGGKVISSNNNSLEAVGLTSGQCIICCPRPQTSTSSSFEVDDNSREEDEQSARIRRLLGLEDPDDAFLSETVPYHVLRAANAAKFVAAFLFFYYTITFIFSLALIFRSEEVHEEIANVNDDDKGVSIFVLLLFILSLFV